MRKSLFFIPIILGLFTSCKSTTQSSVLDSTYAVSSESVIELDTSTSVITSIDEMCSYLEENKVVFGERKKMYVSSVGAIDGTKYIDCSAEIYLYENDAPKTWTSLGIPFTFDATNGKFALIFSYGVEADDNVISCFKKARTK